LSPTSSACHQLPPSLEMWAEGYFFVTHTLCLPPTFNVARNAGGGVFSCHLHSLPAANLLRRSKHSREGFFVTHTPCLPPTSSVARNTAGGVFFVTHTPCLPPTSSVAQNTAGRVFFVTHISCLPPTPLLLDMRAEGSFSVTHTLCLPPTPLRHLKRRRRDFFCSLPATKTSITFSLPFVLSLFLL
jgi:hypothetical protein